MVKFAHEGSNGSSADRASLTAAEQWAMGFITSYEVFAEAQGNQVPTKGVSNKEIVDWMIDYCKLDKSKTVASAALNFLLERAHDMVHELEPDTH